MLADLLERYREPGRHYHTLDHVDAVLDQLDAVRSELEHPADAALAVWFHDAVYHPTRRDSEEQSAALARQQLERAGAPAAQIARITSIILDTRHQQPASSPDGALVADADLAILAAPPDEFGRYEKAIRQEYSHLTDAEFARGRKQFVEAALRRWRIYQSPSFARLELRARENLQRSLDGRAGRL